MRSFDLRPQIERLVAAGVGRIQRIQEDVYRKLWPETVEMPAAYEGRFDRALCVDAFPIHPMHTAVDDHRGRRISVPLRLLPLGHLDKPTALAFEQADEAGLEPLHVPGFGTLIRYVIFWQTGERWGAVSPNAAHARFSADECGLRLNEALQLPLQEEALVRSHDVPITHEPDPHGVIPYLWWEKDHETPTFQARFGIFQVPGGVPSRAKRVIVVSTEHHDFFLKE